VRTSRLKQKDARNGERREEKGGKKDSSAVMRQSMLWPGPPVTVVAAQLGSGSRRGVVGRGKRERNAGEGGKQEERR
jgi:hypothetical protein